MTPPTTPTPPQTPAQPPYPGLRLLVGGLLANAIGGALVGLSMLVARVILHDATVAGTVATVDFLIVPVVIGLVAAWWWRRIPLTRGAIALHGLWVAATGLGGAACFFGEGVVCLLMAAPFHYLWVVVPLGAGHTFFAARDSRLRAALVPFAAAVLIADAQLPHPPARETFVDEVRIQAPPDRVWPHVVAFDPIPAPPDFWVFRLGLPYPVKTPPGADGVGKERLCVFSGGVVFRERVAVFDPPRRLAFDIVEQPNDPELLGHFQSHRGEFELRDEGDGTTTLIGRSDYTLLVRPHWYFDWWTRYLGRAVHLRVMENAKRLAESSAPNNP